MSDIKESQHTDRFSTHMREYLLNSTLPNDEIETLAVMLSAPFKAGVVEYADSKWSTGVVMAKKKGTTDMRYAVDCRGLNQELMGNVIGVPRIDDLLDHWGKADFFSTFDLASAFWSIPMRKSDKNTLHFTHTVMAASSSTSLRLCHSAYPLVAVSSKWRFRLL